MVETLFEPEGSIKRRYSCVGLSRLSPWRTLSMNYKCSCLKPDFKPCVSCFYHVLYEWFTSEQGGFIIVECKPLRKRALCVVKLKLFVLYLLRNLCFTNCHVRLRNNLNVRRFFFITTDMHKVK